MQRIEKDIIKEAKQYIRQNKGFKIDPQSTRAFSYSSPRVTSEFMDCSLPFTFDQYSFCSLTCSYCFARIAKANNPSFSSKLHAVNYKNLIRTIRGKPQSARDKVVYEHFFSKRFVLHWGGLADPFCNFEIANGIGYKITKALAKEKYPTLICSKGTAIRQKHFRELFAKYAHQKNFAFQISIVSASDEVSRRIEIGVATTSKRLKTLKELSDMGYYTILRLRPFIIGVTDDGLEDLLYRAKEAGVRAISTEFIALDLRNNEQLLKRYKWIGELMGTKDVLQYFKALSPSERGGYLRLNRLVKERFIKRIYKFCLDNDIYFGTGDPDYKELTMTDICCCGIPSKCAENPELGNWSKDNLGDHIRHARRAYHLNGRIVSFKFDKVYNYDRSTFLNAVELASDHVAVSGKTASERKQLTFLEIARACWNNLRSPGNPQNYFHGKLLPFRIDENENYVYRYTPSEWEQRWAAEDIDLTR